jgi:hypothetical protein
MSNTDRIPLAARLLLALAGRGLPSSETEVHARLGAALAVGLPLRALPLALLRLRRHLRGTGVRG